MNIALICEGNPADLLGQWVLVHVGFAMSIIDEDEAKATLDALAPNGLRHYQRVMISFRRPDKTRQRRIRHCARLPDAA
ncbi:hydrogenase-2 component protein [Escherichia coli]|uniref:Hydrogenase-2 component protein n=1 Tax=Escherichia coli TaxID=562 RepID=A0A376ZIK6_ECOLX|nr:hydrogenase-2 component protein [Escherichia coli]